MNSLLWSAAAVVSTGIILWLVARAVMSGAPGRAGDEPLPPTHLQRASRWSLVLAAIPAGAGAVLLAAMGPEHAIEDAALRVPLYGLALASLLAAAGGAWSVTRRGRENTGGVVVDERDRAILERAPVVQSGATILVLAAWTVVLTERFWSSGAVPLAYLQLVFWSCLLVNLLGLPAGVLAGYRKA